MLRIGIYTMRVPVISLWVELSLDFLVYPLTLLAPLAILIFLRQRMRSCYDDNWMNTFVGMYLVVGV